VFKPAPILGHKELTGNRRLAPPPAANNRGAPFFVAAGRFQRVTLRFSAVPRNAGAVRARRRQRRVGRPSAGAAVREADRRSARGPRFAERIV